MQLIVPFALRSCVINHDYYINSVAIVIRPIKAPTTQSVLRHLRLICNTNLATQKPSTILECQKIGIVLVFQVNSFQRKMHLNVNRKQM
jgi:hypothetical protein